MLRTYAEAIKDGSMSPRVDFNRLPQSKGNPIIQRAVQITESYQVIDDFDPAAQTKKGNRALGRTDPILNTQSQVPRLHRNRFLRALNKPTLARRNLDDIPRPDLSDPVLDPVRANLALIMYGQRNSRRVKLVQEALVAWGRGLDTPVDMLPVFGLDGIFKEETLAAVKRFQQQSSVAADVIVGPQTLSALQKAMDELHGSIFSLDTVGRNDFEGLIHTPPPSPSWTALNTTQNFVINHVVSDPLHKALLANHFA
ncbi:MAG: peptidoglycan-binding domain-containing protein, partial [Acidobacteriota bacterium]